MKTLLFALAMTLFTAPVALATSTGAINTDVLNGLAGHTCSDYANMTVPKADGIASGSQRSTPVSSQATEDNQS